MKKLILLLFLSNYVFAENNFYIYGGLGETILQTSSTDAANQINATDTPLISASFNKFDKNNLSKNISLGFSFNESLSIEAGYADLGSYKQILNGTYSGGETTTYSPKSEIDAFRINAVYKYDFIKKIDFLFKLGVSQTSNNVTTYLTPPVGPSFKEKVTRPFIGLGLEKNINENVFVRLDWDRYYTRFNYGPDYSDNPTPTYYGGDVQTKVMPLDNFYLSFGYRF